MCEERVWIVILVIDGNETLPWTRVSERVQGCSFSAQCQLRSREYETGPGHWRVTSLHVAQPERSSESLSETPSAGKHWRPRLMSLHSSSFLC